MVEIRNPKSSQRLKSPRKKELLSLNFSQQSTLGPALVYTRDSTAENVTVHHHARLSLFVGHHHEP
jgi:hypothetical protein